MQKGGLIGWHLSYRARVRLESAHHVGVSSGPLLSARANRASCSDPFPRLRCAPCQSRMSLSPILVIGGPSCAPRGSFTQRIRHERCQSRQRGQIHLAAILNAHPRAGYAVEHPERNFLPEVRDGFVESASRAGNARLLYDITDPDKAAAPGMPSIKHPAGVGPMGGAVSRSVVQH